MKEFGGKTAIITGAGSGLGRSLALQLYAAGATLALCDIDFAGIEETLRITEDSGAGVSLHQVDVADRQQMSQFASEVVTHHGAVDILINNYGANVNIRTKGEI